MTFNTASEGKTIPSDIHIARAVYIIPPIGDLRFLIYIQRVMNIACAISAAAGFRVSDYIPNPETRLFKINSLHTFFRLSGFPGLFFF